MSFTVRYYVDSKIFKVMAPLFKIQKGLKLWWTIIYTDQNKYNNIFSTEILYRITWEYSEFKTF